MNGQFGWSDFWQKHLEATGRFEVTEVISNAETLQKTWAKEQHIGYSGNSWAQEIVAAQVRAVRPDVFFAHDYGTLGQDLWQALKRDAPGLKVVGYDGVALCDPGRFAGCDLIFTSADFISASYRRAGMHAHSLKLGFETSLRSRLQFGRELYGVSFLGGVNLGRAGHTRRIRLLYDLKRRLPIELFLQMQSSRAALRSVASCLKRGDWRYALQTAPGQLARAAILRAHARPPLFGLEMLQAVADSKITINIHIDASGDTAGNMRLFEATGAGSCLVTDWKENLPNFFEVDREVAAFRTLEECVDKVTYLLTHEPERRAMAAAGMNRTLRDHNLESSISEAGEQIKGLFDRKS